MRAVVLARDISYDGAIQFDDLHLEILPTLNAPVIQQINTLERLRMRRSMGRRRQGERLRGGCRHQRRLPDGGPGLGSLHLGIWRGHRQRAVHRDLERHGQAGGPDRLSPVGHQRGRQLV